MKKKHLIIILASMVLAVGGCLSLIYIGFYVPPKPVNDITVGKLAQEELANLCMQSNWKASDFRRHGRVITTMVKKDVFLGIGTKEIRAWHYQYRSIVAPVRVVDVYINERGYSHVFFETL